MKTIAIQGIELKTAGEALQHTEASGRGQVIHVGGKYLVVERAEADRLAEMGVFFAHVIDHEMPNGSFRIMTVPVNE